jgi:uncharacterized protein (TIGR02466 family)
VEWIVYCGGSKMILWNVFRADVLVRNVGSVEQRNNLLQQALFAKEQEPAKMNSNDGCWRSNFDYQNIDWLVEEIKFSLSNLIDFYMKEDPSYQHRFNPSINKIDHWTNINDPHSSNRLHIHRSYDYVACYYMQAEGTGDLTFHNPANLMSECGHNTPFISRMTYQPKDGDLLVWPGWIPHEVEVNHSDRQRVNIAFNIKL